MNNPSIGSPVPFITTAQMVEIDRAMVEDYGIDLLQMMEMAGRALADLARRRFLDRDAAGATVTVLAGTGGNGGGALVAARRLHTWGAFVEVYLTQPPERFTGVPAHQLEILNRIGVPIGLPEDLPEQLPASETEREAAADRPPEPPHSRTVILDGVIGYSLRGAPRGAAADLIRWANASRTPCLSLDVPSGVDATSGSVFSPAIRAAATLTLALPKVGLGHPAVAPYVGELYLADIGVPPELYESDGIRVSARRIFQGGDIVRLV